MDEREDGSIPWQLESHNSFPSTNRWRAAMETEWRMTLEGGIERLIDTLQDR